MASVCWATYLELAQRRGLEHITGKRLFDGGCHAGSQHLQELLERLGMRGHKESGALSRVPRAPWPSAAKSFAAPTR